MYLSQLIFFIVILLIFIMWIGSRNMSNDKKKFSNKNIATNDITRFIVSLVNTTQSGSSLYIKYDSKILCKIVLHESENDIKTLYLNFPIVNWGGDQIEIMRDNMLKSEFIHEVNIKKKCLTANFPLQFEGIILELVSIIENVLNILGINDSDLLEMQYDSKLKHDRIWKLWKHFHHGVGPR